MIVALAANSQSARGEYWKSTEPFVEFVLNVLYCEARNGLQQTKQIKAQSTHACICQSAREGFLQLDQGTNLQTDYTNFKLHFKSFKKPVAASAAGEVPEGG